MCEKCVENGWNEGVKASVKMCEQMREKMSDFFSSDYRTE